MSPCLQALLALRRAGHIWKEALIFQRQLRERRALNTLLAAVDAGHKDAEALLSTLLEVHIGPLVIHLLCHCVRDAWLLS